MNLKEETLEALLANKKTPNDVLFVSDGEQYILFDAFLELADFDYDDGFGGNEINILLKIVGKDWWLERYEYDGSECWNYKTIPLIENLAHEKKEFCVTDEEYWEKRV